MTTLIFTLLLLSAATLAVIISVIDWKHRLIPDIYLFPLLLIGLIVVAFFDWPTTVGDSVIAAAFGYFLALGIGKVFERIKSYHVSRITYHDVIGLGDVKLLAVGGIWLGVTGLSIAIVLSCVFGGIWGLRKKQKFIPFAPFFFAGALCALMVMCFVM